MPHKNGESNYRKIKIGAFMNNNCSSKQWVARCHVDMLSKLKLVAPFRRTIILHFMPQKMGRLIIGK